MLYSRQVHHMRVAMVHDWLNGMRGGEMVLECLLPLFPESSIYTLFHERGKLSPAIESRRIITSWLNQIPGVYRHYRSMLPLFPSAIESFDLSAFDLVISSSHAVAKGVRTGNATHICYCHTPMRYIWDAEQDYAVGPLRRLAMQAFRGRLQRWDCEAAARVHYFLANSRFVRERIHSYYGRDAEVIYPPVDTHFFKPSEEGGGRDDFYLAGGAQAPYKRFDLIIEAFKRIGRRLVIAGGGESSRLRRMAADNIEIRGWVSREELRRLYQRARAMIVAAREDFGIVTVEAQACGCPVIAFGAGGSTEIVQDGINGILFVEQHADDIVAAVRRFETMSWPPEQVRSQVDTFSKEVFQSRIQKFVTERINSRAALTRGSLQPA